MKPVPKKLRASAEKLLATTRREVAEMPVDDVQKLVHELQVHQIELEMQNDELRQTQLELEAARERLLLPYDAAPVGFLALDVRGVILEANLAAARLLNFDRLKLSGQKMTQFIAPESQDIFYLSRRQLLNTAEKQTCELQLLRAGGSPVIVRLEMVLDNVGLEPGSRCLVMVSEITEQKRAEEIHARLAAIVESSDDAIISKDLDGRVKTWNEGAERLFGYGAEEMIGQSILRIIPADLEAEEVDILNRLRGGESIAHYETERLTKSGKRVPVSLTISPIRNSSGIIIGASKIARDITERRKIEAALRESERRERERAQELAVLIYAIPTPVMIVHDPDSRHITGNRAANHLLRVAQGTEISMSAPDELKPVHFKNIKDGRELGIEELPAQRAARGETIKDFEFDLVFTDGAVRNLLGYGTPLRDDHGRPRGALHTLVDITERKRAEEALRQARDELEDRVRERTTELTWANTALRGEKAFSDSLIELAPAVIVVVDAQGNLIRTNAYAEQLTGYTSAETEGRDMVAMFVPAEEQPRIRHLLQAALQGRAVPAVVAPLLTRDGRIRRIEWLCKPLANAAGRLTALLAIGHDVTKPLQLQAALQTSEAKFRGFVESAPDGIVVVNQQGRIVLMNAQIGRMFGYLPEELTGRPLESLLPKRFRDRHAGHFQKFFSAPRSRPMGTGLELSARRKNGREFPVEITLSPVATEEGLVVFSAIRDITERKEAEAALRRSEHHLSNFFDQAPIGLLWLSAGGTILRVNQAQLDMIGCSAKDFLGHSFSEFITEPAHGYELLQWLANRETVRNLRMPLRSKNGGIRQVLVDANSFWSGKQFEYSSVFLRDITDRVNLEWEILHISEREHRRIAQDLHDGLGQLLVGAAYLAGTVRQDLAARRLPEARKLGRIGEVINEAVAQSRNLARGLHPVEPEPNGLMAALESLAARTKKLFQVRCHFSCRRPVLIPDNTVATHLFRIAQEAVTNAIKHGKPGHIEISLTRTPARISLAVKDDGSGMPARRRKKAGMGLHIMRYRAGMIGGSLAVQKEPGGGTTVVCTVHRPDEDGPKRKRQTARKKNLRKE